MENMIGDQRLMKAELARSLAVTLGSAYAMLIKTAGMHWNVKGPDFSEYHEFFSEIYEDIDSMIDPAAEDILKLGFDAPSSLTELIQLSKVSDNTLAYSEPVQMCRELLIANETMLAQIAETFGIANAMNEQGIANFMAERDNMHKKWGWQLRAITGLQSHGSAESSHVEVTVVAEINDMNCPYCDTMCQCSGPSCACPPFCTCGCRDHATMSEPMYSSGHEHVVIAEERELAEALIEITRKHGKFNSDDSGVWAGYESAAENENAEQGVKCANCILYAGGTSCKIIATEVEPGGYCRFALIPDGVVTAAASKPAPKKDQIKGSDKNKPGSAAGRKKIVFSDKVEKALENKVSEHNEKATAGRKATLGMLKAVYRRGAGAFSSSHRPGMTRDQWAMARVNAYLRLLKSGTPANANYKQDNDLLPAAHPKSTNSGSTITASAVAESELTIELMREDMYDTSEHAILAMAEYSGLGYDVIPAFRAAWIRGVNANQNPFARAKELAVDLYESKDADLLPTKK